MARFRYELSATILAEAEFALDKIVCDRYGISERSLRNWRKQMTTDEQLAALFRFKRDSIASEWDLDAQRTLKALQDYQRRAALEGDPTSPKMVRALAGAQKVIQDGLAGKRILDARIRMLSRSVDGSPMDGNRRALGSPAGSEREDGADPPPDTD